MTFQVNVEVEDKVERCETLNGTKNCRQHLSGALKIMYRQTIKLLGVKKTYWCQVTNNTLKD